MPCFFISAFMICVTSGTQPPHDVPAPVHDFSAPMVVAPSATAAQICAFDVVARADLRAVRQRVDAERGLGRAVRRRQDQELGAPAARCGSASSAAACRIRRIAHHHRAEQELAAVGHHQLLVDLRRSSVNW
jgi:hypothetical protein